MSWINNMLGNENQNEKALNDKDYAIQLLEFSKNNLTMLTKCITEAYNPQLRNIFSNQLNSSINDYFKLSDLANQKGFYNAFTSPSAQIKQEIQDAQTLQEQK